MATKTLTITEDAYGLLSVNKLEGESFSKEIKRILSKKRMMPLSDFFGIISKEDGADILRILEKKRKENVRMTLRRRFV